MHNLLLYNLNLCYNLMKKSLFEHAMAYKKFVKQFQNIAKKKLKNSDIKTSERLKNIIESNELLLRNY